MEQENDRAYVEFWRQFNDGRSPHDDGTVRCDLLEALSEDQRGQAAVHLLARLKRAPRDRRIVHALGYLRVEAAVAPLERLARDRSRVGVEALLALWRIDGREERVTALVGALQQTFPGRLRQWLVGSDAMRAAAAAALGSVNVPASIAALREATRDLDPRVRFNARQSLRLLGATGTAPGSGPRTPDSSRQT